MWLPSLQGSLLGNTVSHGQCVGTQKFQTEIEKVSWVIKYLFLLLLAMFHLSLFLNHGDEEKISEKGRVFTTTCHTGTFFVLLFRRQKPLSLVIFLPALFFIFSNRGATWEFLSSVMLLQTRIISFLSFHVVQPSAFSVFFNQILLTPRTSSYSA